MHTKFKLLFDSSPPDINLTQFNSSLPIKMEVIEEIDGIYLKVESESAEDEKCQYLIDRELDRHRFLTAVKIKSEMVKQAVTTSLGVSRTIHNELPDNISPQVWSKNLATQFRLWNLASDSEDNMLKVILYYQIIELKYISKNDFPKYTDSTSAPSVISEAKFIRHLVAHSGEVNGVELKNYCEYIGIPELMFDPTDIGHTEIIRKKLPLLEAEAKKVISDAL